MNNSFFIEVGSHSRMHFDERICGDVFLSRKSEGNQRTISVLSDGMGHGVKANILATLTATITLNFTEEHEDPNKIVSIIMKTLPICSERQLSYSTFTVVDTDINSDVSIIEFDNPQSIILRGKNVYDPEWQCIFSSGEASNGKEILTCKFTPQKEDRIIIWTDGITQSGLGLNEYPRGWGIKEAMKFVHKMVNSEPHISAQKLAEKVVNMAYVNDMWQMKDDATCAVLYFRTPRKLLICTGPPVAEANDKHLGHRFAEFIGAKIICGATTANIIARETNNTISDEVEVIDPSLPPISHMESADLITEGILTLTKAHSILENYNEQTILGDGPAHKIVRFLTESDEISFLVGTRINEANQDPSFPLELEMRRSIVNRIKAILEHKFLKEVTIEYI